MSNARKREQTRACLTFLTCFTCSLNHQRLVETSFCLQVLQKYNRKYFLFLYPFFCSLVLFLFFQQRNQIMDRLVEFFREIKGNTLGISYVSEVWLPEVRTRFVIVLIVYVKTITHV